MSAIGTLALGLAASPEQTAQNWGTSSAALKTRLQQALAAGRPLWTRPWEGPSAWVPLQAVKQGDVRKNSAAQWYVAGSAGTCGATEPTHTSGAAVSDGGVLWTHLGGPSWDAADDPAKPILTPTNSTSTPAGLTALDVWANRALFTFNGCAPAQYATNRAYLNVFTIGVGGAVQRGGFVAFWSDAPKIGFEAPSGTAGMRIFCDGRPLTAGPIYPFAASNFWEVVDWGTRKPRLWEIHYGRDNATFMQIAITSADQIWPAPSPGTLRGGALGDSYLAGSSYGPFILGDTLPEHFGRLIGVDDMWRLGIGGTGLLNPGTGPYYTYRERVPQLLALKPDVIFLQGSTNDIGSNQAAITAEALACIDAIRGGAGGQPGSSAPIFWFGPAPISGSYSSIQAVDAAIKAACDARPGQNIFYKSLVTATPPWLTGSHNNASYSWSSNISQYIGGDNVHPVDKGTMYFAGRMASAYANEMLPLVA
ncbi:lysophospholipase L1-like esterase [Xanthobacter flavus]|uniref:Lysophospholipase L1-like esterase n=1 Tax=Xanthobacter flavus TaxID=281 RepID=A0A9W6CN86_XANFL|nr:SGNH/GDSL hydrolase family protein [Xanthobacter flavus]MDR6334480.1 lysophospholipase L1-like esterase [Xanthobacter flavus]GLI23500.1 hypothetical protein XFLAVUS301_31740 [Xanthobacter flavus]